MLIWNKELQKIKNYFYSHVNFVNIIFDCILSCWQVAIILWLVGFYENSASLSHPKTWVGSGCVLLLSNYSIQSGIPIRSAENALSELPNTAEEDFAWF